MTPSESLKCFSMGMRLGTLKLLSSVFSSRKFNAQETAAEGVFLGRNLADRRKFGHLW